MNPKIDSKGHKYWYNDKGLLHRLNGPAIEYFNSSKSWYIDDLKYTHDRLLKYLLT